MNFELNHTAIPHPWLIQLKLNSPIQDGESGLSLTQNSWFNSCHDLFPH